jgi:hypothetical protein
MGSSRLSPTGWTVVITLAEMPSAAHALECDGKTTTGVVVF